MAAVASLQTVVELEHPRQDATLNLPLIIGQTVLKNLKHPVTTFRTIVVVEGRVELVREEVPAVVTIPMPWVEGVDSPEGGVLPCHRRVGAPAVVVEGGVRYGPSRARNVGPSIVSIRDHLLYSMFFC